MEKDKEVMVKIVLKGATLEDYRDEDDSFILDAFKTFYDINHPEFNLKLVKD